ARLAELVDLPGLAAAPPAGAEIAATEDCQWRGRVLVGEVHDENAAGLGGFAGHAGLFGTMDGVLDAAAAILSGTWLGPAAMEVMSARHTPTRAFGWQIRHAVPAGAEPPWTGGSLCSARTIGHTGFTGTGLWIDLERGYAWALLTNRVHPTRHAETGIQDLRRAVGNRLAAAVTA
ncbi:MAG: serine hydrolase, partial [Rhodospirillaceae bacterium]|nr:serine hydrolase [Rhodospirillaceae bacterium]